jgi:hypothetical protein
MAAGLRNRIDSLGTQLVRQLAQLFQGQLAGIRRPFDGIQQWRLAIRHLLSAAIHINCFEL